MKKENFFNPVINRENKELMKALQELRKSSASSPHKNKKKYNRKEKHKNKNLE